MKQFISNILAGNKNDDIDKNTCERIFIKQKTCGSIVITRTGIDVKRVYRECIFKNNVCVEII